jgi:hypothetical protein
MKKIFKSSIFWAIFVLATLVVFSFLTNLSRVFRAETDLLIVAKNELTAKNFDGIVNDSLHIPYSLSFYEKIIFRFMSICLRNIYEKTGCVYSCYISRCGISIHFDNHKYFQEKDKNDSP